MYKNPYLILIILFLFYFRKEDAEKLYVDAAALNLTDTDFVWIVTEQALAAYNVPLGKLYRSCMLMLPL